MGKLTGKTALITGASKGIGEGIARAFAKHGANLVLAARGSETQALAQSLCESGAKAIAVKMDVSDMASVQAGYEAAVQAFGGVVSLCPTLASAAWAIFLPRAMRTATPIWTST